MPPPKKKIISVPPPSITHPFRPDPAQNPDADPDPDPDPGGGGGGGKSAKIVKSNRERYRLTLFLTKALYYPLKGLGHDIEFQYLTKNYISRSKNLTMCL